MSEKNPILVLFIDALPYDRGINIVNELKSTVHSRTVPGVGYSINVKAELFAGLNPDEVGYFCEWNYDSSKEIPLWASLLTPVVEFFTSKVNLINRIVHRLVGDILGHRVYAIPYRVLPLLVNSGATAYDWPFTRSTVFSEGGFDRVLYSEEGVDDEKVFKKALSALSQKDIKRLFVSTAELDGVMHHHGMHCKEYEDQILLLEKYTVELINKFIEKNGEDSRYFIISDHGMAPVENAIEYDIESKFGKPGKKTYIHFIDATFFRVWVNDKSLEKPMLESFAKLDGGHIMTDQEREHHGLVDKKHGDIIFTLDEGNQFAPSFFGNDTCKAMHGYDPELESQLGVFISNIENFDATHIKAKEIYSCIKSYI